MELEEKMVLLVRMYLEDKEDEFASKWEEWFSGDTSGRNCYRVMKLKKIICTEPALIEMACWLRLRNCHREDWSVANHRLAVAVGRVLDYYWHMRSWWRWDDEEVEMGYRREKED